MKLGNLLHPDNSRPLRHGFRLQFVPHNAPISERLQCWARNLWNEWYAAMSDEAVDRFRRAGLTLLVMLVVGIFFFAIEIVRRDAATTYMVYKSNRTGQIVKVFGPDGKEIKMSPDDARKLRGAEVVLVP